MKYPFEPRSTTSLQQGHYWCFELVNGRFASGVVLAHALRNGKIDSRLLCVGLLDWVGDAPATAEQLNDVPVRDRGFIHVRSIQQNGRIVLGRVNQDWEIPAVLDFSHQAGSGISVWGLAVIRNLAELTWGDSDWVRKKVEACWDANPKMKKRRIDT